MISALLAPEHPPALVLRTHCPACGSTPAKTLFCMPFSAPIINTYINKAYLGKVDVSILKHSNLEFRICLCCRLIYQSYILNPAGLKLLYDIWIDPGRASAWHTQGIRRTQNAYASRIALAKKLLPSSLRLLDFGAGFGLFSEMAARAGFNVTALDISSDRERRLRRPGVTVISTLEETDQQFDLINVDQVLEHLSNPYAVLHQLAQHLHKNGIFYVSVPNAAGIEHTLPRLTYLNDQERFNALLPAIPLQHINSFSRHALHRLLRRCGLRVMCTPIQELVAGLASGLMPTPRNILRPFYHFFTTSCIATLRHSEAGKVMDDEEGNLLK
jgi:2-polyprenyl-3-methyl-5-hydroxy-6-metoxy-1,4-benzoquinol methylase